MGFGRDRSVRFHVVVRQQLGELALALLRLPLDPLRHPRVRPGPIPPREALVGDILDQDVPEGELTFADDR